MITYEEMTFEALEELSTLYVETFNAAPWHDEWTIGTAKKRLHQMLSIEDAYGLCAYEEGKLCGAVLGNIEQYYNGTMFNLKEFWVANSKRGQGIGTSVYEELEKRLKAKGVGDIILFTLRGDYTEHFYEKQQFKTDDHMVFMTKKL